MDRSLVQHKLPSLPTTPSTPADQKQACIRDAVNAPPQFEDQTGKQEREADMARQMQAVEVRYHLRKTPTRFTYGSQGVHPVIRSLIFEIYGDEYSTIDCEQRQSYFQRKPSCITATMPDHPLLGSCTALPEASASAKAKMTVVVLRRRTATGMDRPKQIFLWKARTIGSGDIGGEKGTRNNGIFLGWGLVIALVVSDLIQRLNDRFRWTVDKSSGLICE